MVWLLSKTKLSCKIETQGEPLQNSIKKFPFHITLLKFYTAVAKSSTYFCVLHAWGVNFHDFHNGAYEPNQSVKIFRENRLQYNMPSPIYIVLQKFRENHNEMHWFSF